MTKAALAIPRTLGATGFVNTQVYTKPGVYKLDKHSIEENTMTIGRRLILFISICCVCHRLSSTTAGKVLQPLADSATPQSA